VTTGVPVGVPAAGGGAGPALAPDRL